MLYRQWSFRRQRKQLSGQNAGADAHLGEIPDPSSVDPVTGLHTRAFIEQQLGKEIAHARRQNTALSLATVHLDEFAEINKRYGQSATDEALKELARRFEEGVSWLRFRRAPGQRRFPAVLPECNLGEVKAVLNRLGALEMVCSGRKMNLVLHDRVGGLSTWRPARGFAQSAPAQLLHLYENAAKKSLSSTLAPH